MSDDEMVSTIKAALHIDQSQTIKHTSLKERFDKFEGEIEPLQEFDWGEPVGREVW